jgi:uncharacterized protein (DUF608 family)
VAAHADRLLAETRAWQELILRSTLPEWLKAELINDAFPLVRQYHPDPRRSL